MNNPESNVKESTERVGQILPRVLTGMLEPTTKGKPNSTIYARLRRLAQFETLNDPQLEKFLDAAATFAASVNYTTPYWLTLSGESGTGKTKLAKAVARQFMDQNRFELHYDKSRNWIGGNTMMFVDWRKFCDQIRGGDYELVDDICEEWFVIIDDLGTERDPTGFIASKTDQILNSRLRKWTMITTNLPLSAIAERMDTRIASRMIRDNNQVVEIDVPDWNRR